MSSGAWDAESACRGRDLDDVVEIEEFVRRFYRDVAQDDLLGPIFNDVAHVDWAEHLPKLVAYWSRNLLGVPGYMGNPFRAHLSVHRKQSFTTADFDRWLEMFVETVDGGWSGPMAEKAKRFATNVALVQHRRLVGGELLADNYSRIH